MIGCLSGTIQFADLDAVCINAGGVGYVVHMPLPDVARHSHAGAKIEVFVHTHVREDAIVLYGSKARGDDTPDSDIDLLVLTGRPLTPEETGRMRELVRRVGLRLGTWPELYVRTSDEWWHGVYQAAPIRKEIDAEGIDVFRVASGGRT